tara:strand:+ start:994 stop:1332 length:339 start_codon:yes stop_codon:yes gene_type:complete
MTTNFIHVPCYTVQEVEQRRQAEFKNIFGTKKRSSKRKSAKTKTKLTINFKHGVAENIIAAIKEGNDTFGKLRKALQHTDRELKSGLRYGLANWVYKTKVSKDKKTYSLIKL